MADPGSTLRMFLPAALADSLRKGSHNFLGLVSGVARDAGLKVDIVDREGIDLRAEERAPGYSFFHMEPPFSERSVTVRRAYAYPFWAIERSAERWNWTVAKTRFDAERAAHPDAERFCRYWRGRLFRDVTSWQSQGFVFVPLQGRLGERRRFQTMSPLDMIEAVLEHDSRRPVVATLHPSETHPPRDLDALGRLEKRFPRFSVQTGGSEQFLAGCDYVVTQNSSLGFFGYLFSKPCVLFARSDFHHVAANVHEVGAADAVRTVLDTPPPFATYVHWFWQQMSTNAGRPEAPDKIRERLRMAGFPV